jgi:hypothetical protein
MSISNQTKSILSVLFIISFIISLAIIRKLNTERLLKAQQEAIQEDPYALTPEENAAIEDGVNQEFQQIDAEKAAAVPTPAPTPAPAPAPASATKKPQEIKSGIDAPAYGKIKKTSFVKANEGMIIGTSIQLAISILSMKFVRTGIKAGAIASAKVGAYVLRKIGLKIVVGGLTKLGIVAARMANQSALAAMTGPAAPFVEGAFFAFDILSIGMDIGDAGGYVKAGSNEMYFKMRDGIMEEMKKAYAEEGMTYPIIAGPVDKIDEATLTTLMEKFFTELLSTPEFAFVLEPLVQKIVESGIDPDVNPVKFDKLIDDILPTLDMSPVANAALNKICEQYGGTPYSINGNQFCSYKTRKECDDSFHWPALDGETYVEWKRDASSGSEYCAVGSGALRGICEDNNLTYDSIIGSCKIDEKYCRTKGMEWKYNDKIKEMDCHVSKGQNIAEAIFGTTVVRGLDNVFDTKNFEKCKPGYTEKNYFCVNSVCPDGMEKKTAGIQSIAIAGAIATGGVAGAAAGIFAGSTMTGSDGIALCYPMCKQGYKGVASVCWEECKSGFTDIGAMCSRSNYCNPEEEHEGRLCYPQCKAGYEGKVTKCYQRCPAPFKDDGFTGCLKPTLKGGSYGRGVGKAPSMRPCSEFEAQYGPLEDKAGSCWSK